MAVRRARISSIIDNKIPQMKNSVIFENVIIVSFVYRSARVMKDTQTQKCNVQCEPSVSPKIHPIITCQNTVTAMDTILLDRQVQGQNVTSRCPCKGLSGLVFFITFSETKSPPSSLHITRLHVCSCVLCWQTMKKKWFHCTSGLTVFFVTARPLNPINEHLEDHRCWSTNSIDY